MECRGPVSLSKSKLKFACNARFLFYKDGAICAKNSPKRTSYGVPRAIVKGTSLRSPSPIMAPAQNSFQGGPAAFTLVSAFLSTPQIN